MIDVHSPTIGSRLDPRCRDPVRSKCNVCNCGAVTERGLTAIGQHSDCAYSQDRDDLGDILVVVVNSNRGVIKYNRRCLCIKIMEIASFWILLFASMRLI